MTMTMLFGNVKNQMKKLLLLLLLIPNLVMAELTPIPKPIYLATTNLSKILNRKVYKTKVEKEIRKIFEAKLTKLYN